MLKKIDFYIIKKFLGTYVFAIVLIISIAVVFDINEKIDDFINAPLKEIIFDYYLNFIPYYTNLFSQLFTFIAVIFFTSKLADNSEIIAMLSSGISFKRLMIPYMVSAAIISSLTFTLNSFVIPPANKTRIEFQNKYVSNKKVDYAANVQLQVSPGVIAYINRYDDNLKTGYRFSMEKFEGKSLRSKLTAESMPPNPQGRRRSCPEGSHHQWRNPDHRHRPLPLQFLSEAGAGSQGLRPDSRRWRRCRASSHPDAEPLQERPGLCSDQ